MTADTYRLCMCTCVALKSAADIGVLATREAKVTLATMKPDAALTNITQYNTRHR
jgi:hypothetical protein